SMRLGKVIGMVVAAAWATGAAASARADVTCGDAYEQTQELRRAGKLQEARAKAAICMADACAEVIRKDCGTWADQILAAQPSVVVVVHDTAGKETTAVTVAVDGKPWLDHLDGTAKDIDPGAHVLRFTLAGAPPLDQPVTVHEGEKARKIEVSF